MGTDRSGIRSNLSVGASAGACPILADVTIVHESGYRISALALHLTSRAAACADLSIGDSPVLWRFSLSSGLGLDRDTKRFTLCGRSLYELRKMAHERGMRFRPRMPKRRAAGRKTAATEHPDPRQLTFFERT